jgi:tetratricopeptide (TPR) repeat protein
MKKMKREKTIPPAKKAVLEKPDSLLFTTLTLSFVIICALAAAAYQRNSIFHDNVTLWDNNVRTSPNKSRAHENYGHALSVVGRFDEALREFNTAIALKEDGSVKPYDLYRLIGTAYLRMDRMDDAIAAYKTGLGYAQNDPHLLNNLSVALLQTGRVEEAELYAQAALSAAPSMPESLNNMGHVLMMKRDYEKSAGYFLKAIELQPEGQAKYWNAALVLERAGKYEMALQYARKYVEREQDGAARQRAYAFMEHLTKMTGR